MHSVSLHAIPDIPEIKPGDELPKILGDAIEACGLSLKDGDVLTSAHKIFSKAEGRIVNLTTVTPSQDAKRYGEELNKDPRKVEVILQESRRVVRHFKRPTQHEGTIICEHKLGFISANAAVDESNSGQDQTLILLPEDPDTSARHMQAALSKRFNVRIGFAITDTFGRPWRLGQVNVAVGLSGIPATIKEQGNTDAHGRVLNVTEPAFADELAAASGLVISKAGQTPVVLFRGLSWNFTESSAQNLIRSQKEDMFR
ncbi:Coenzyme F420:L-glutamate ligase [Pseudovibrio axinellae]|uniref:Coenzyme F420:L-glutamate ligase n=1 Tax=Pseudovibrio axinellae TaxID=989403 RepID=A0A165UM82_9HYPH|nr:coenzyme F420-0:L-glutamate ligase [Pseudovibrio axinellae]KZL12546.1 Coenzyme F420:L-glutamate ligase [Pseudovibrio axinellae]SEP67511.1 coenzyme F420-0 gamma-glutamyl ligase [Pseudovibrio axinellae]